MPSTLARVSLDPAALDPTTWVVSAGRPQAAGQPLNHPITPASNFEHGSERVYSRSDATESWEALETVLGGLEDAEALVFASGMAAVSAVFELVPVGGHVVIPDDCYHGVANTAQDGAAAKRWTVTTLPVDDTSAWIDALGTADLVWSESPTNPLLIEADLDAIGRAIAELAAKPKIARLESVPPAVEEAVRKDARRGWWQWTSALSLSGVAGLFRENPEIAAGLLIAAALIGVVAILGGRRLVRRVKDIAREVRAP